MPGEKEINVNLMREKHHVERIAKVVKREGSTKEDILEAINDELKQIDEMLYQSPAAPSGDK